MFIKWVHRVIWNSINLYIYYSSTYWVSYGTQSIYIYIIVPRIGYHTIQQHSQLNPQFNTKLRWAKPFFSRWRIFPCKRLTDKFFSIDLILFVRRSLNLQLAVYRIFNTIVFHIERTSHKKSKKYRLILIV